MNMSSQLFIYNKNCLCDWPWNTDFFFYTHVNTPLLTIPQLLFVLCWCFLHLHTKDKLFSLSRRNTLPPSKINRAQALTEPCYTHFKQAYEHFVQELWKYMTNKCCFCGSMTSKDVYRDYKRRKFSKSIWPWLNSSWLNYYFFVNTYIKLWCNHQVKCTFLAHKIDLHVRLCKIININYFKYDEFDQNIKWDLKNKMNYFYMQRVIRV